MEKKEIRFPNQQEYEDLKAENKILKSENVLMKAKNNALTERTDFHEEVLTEIILTIAP